MFLNFLKNFLIKRKLKKSLLQPSSFFSTEKIKTVGLLIDESYFDKKVKLLSDLKRQGIQEADIKLCLYHDKDKKKDTQFTSFSLKNISWSGEINNQEVVDFTNENFDLLISYYDIEKAPLLLVTLRSKSLFKVGFSNIDKRLNNFMIQSTAEDSAVFVDELFKYLKILNKI